MNRIVQWKGTGESAFPSDIYLLYNPTKGSPFEVGEEIEESERYLGSRPMFRLAVPGEENWFLMAQEHFE